jgi:hypothetical protein
MSIDTIGAPEQDDSDERPPNDGPAPSQLALARLLVIRWPTSNSEGRLRNGQW